MTRTAVYVGTRNMYGDMMTAAKSLLKHKGADVVYFLIEDDKFPYELPSCVKTINVADQTMFDKNGPNAAKKWTWMLLMKQSMYRMFPRIGKVLVLDCDTIVTEPIDKLWNIDITDYCFAGASEPWKTGRFGKPYVNAGVLMHNLTKLRRTGKGDLIAKALNEIDYAYPDQDVLVDVLEDRDILEISSDYNYCAWTKHDGESIIIHYAAIPNWRSDCVVQKYRAMSWEEVLNNG